MPHITQGDPSTVERAVSRTLRDSLERLQRSAAELDQAVADFVAACASNRPANALPSMLRAQTASASLTATLEVLSRFVTSSLQPSYPARAQQIEQTDFPVEVEAPEEVSVPEDVVVSEHVVASEHVAVPERAEAGETPQAHSIASDLAFEAPNARDWPTAPEPTEWSEAHESHDSPVRAEPFEPEPEQLEVRELERELEPALEPERELQIEPLEFEPPPRPELEPVLELAPEPPHDPALEPIVESALSADISAKPDAMEPVATWSAPPQPVEPAAAHFAAGESAPDGIVDEPEFAAESAQATATEESQIIEEAIAGGIEKLSEARLSQMHAAPLEFASAVAITDGPAFDIALLSDNERELHRRASRVAKVSMQDIKMLQPEQVELGRQYKDLCVRLHADIDRAHREYGRRFRPILEHPPDYFYDWMVQILAAGDPSALGEYPYPTQALRR